MSENKKRSADTDDGPVKKKISGAWSAGLYASVEDASLHVYADEKVVIIKDKYPKAKYHYLVLPKQKLENLKKLNKDHVDILEHMAAKGRDLVKDKTSKVEFRSGYHAVPSMGLLHLHVISQDFDSPCLKNKKHWNSFTSEYFIDSDDIISMLKEKGEVKLDTSKFQDILKAPLKCHRCSHQPKTIPALKTHIKIHDKPT